jgi:nucleoside-diphosphate-sugar epimerase
MSRKILVTGSRGVIGTPLTNELLRLGYEVIGTRRRSQSPSQSLEEMVLEPWQDENKNHLKFDHVFHLAGKYLRKDDPNSQQEVFESSVGLTATISSLVSANGAPVTMLGSYFEKSPIDSGWSYYSLAKTSARNLMIQNALKNDSKLVYVYLYDTYSNNLTRNKFIDLVLKAAISHESLPASPGEQVLDLTHVDDVVRGLLSTMDQDMSTNIGEFQIRSREVVTLRQIVEIFESTVKKKLDMQWGALNYRSNEVFSPWECAPDLPNFSCEYNLVDFFTNFANVNAL